MKAGSGKQARHKGCYFPGCVNKATKWYNLYGRYHLFAHYYTQLYAYFRRTALMIWGDHCHKCGEKKYGTEIHHLKSIGIRRHRFEEVRPLCVGCHKVVTLLGRRSYDGR